MIIAKKIESKKLIAYFLVLIVVAFATLVLILSESGGISVSEFLKGGSPKNGQATAGLQPLMTTTLESQKFQLLNDVKVEEIVPTVGQKNPFNERLKK